MANEKHLAILKLGVKSWNKWREENPDIQPNLIGAELGQIDLSKANLNRAVLTNANLTKADLGESDLSWGI